MSKREIYLIITVLSILGAVYPYAYSHWPTKTEWSPILQTPNVNSSTQVYPPWTLFNATPSLASGATIEINVTYGGYSCFNPGGYSVSPEICIFTVASFKQIDYSKPLDQQAVSCGGSQSYTYNNVTNQYIISFQPTLPEYSEYEFISRLVSSCQSFQYQCPQSSYSSPILTISQPSSVNPLQAYGDPQLISLLASVFALIFGYLTITEQKKHH
jgi:hypothetical protein